MLKLLRNLAPYGLSLLIVFVLLAVQPTAAFAGDNEYVTRAEAAEGIVQYMYDLSYGEPFPLDTTYCMHETRSMHFTLPFNEQGEGTYPLLASIYHGTGWNGFSDITAEYENAIALNLAKEMGIVNGKNNGTFCPDEPVTYEQAVKMLVCALGYDKWAESEGGYPEGYLKVAGDIGALGNVRLEADSRISTNEFETLLTDFFDLDYYPLKDVLLNMPVTAEECVRLYAEGVASRNARVQYAVFGDELQRNNKADFEELNWVTGMSSPWYTVLEINSIDDSEYSAVFSLETSSGPDGMMTVKITTEQLGPVYKIIAIEPVK